MITLCGQFLVSRNPTSGSGAHEMSKDTYFTDEKHEADDDSPSSTPLPSPCIHSKRPRVCRHHAHMLKTHVRVVPAYTGVFIVSHTTHHTPHTPRPTTTTTPHGDRHREIETRREEETKEKKTEKTRQQKREQRRFIFSVVVHGRCLLM